MDAEKAGGSISGYFSGSDYLVEDAEEPDYYPKKLSIGESLSQLRLNHIQKILLMTDGTVTELLEYLSREPIVIEKIYQELEKDLSGIPGDHIQSVDGAVAPVLIRKIILKGQYTKKNYIYAESTILVDRLPETFREELIHTKTPIGKLWSKHRLETYKTDFVAVKEKSSESVSSHLSVPVDSDVLSRTYSVYSCGEKSMVITEKFSASLFMD